MEKAFVSWSGGKDCALAFYRATKSGMKVSCLLNMLTQDKERSRSHGVKSEWLKIQAAAIGIPIIQKSASWGDYESQFKSTILDLKKDGVTTGVFGDIDFSAHREWIERVCSETAITPVLPLWEQDQTQILKEFIDSGFEAIVVATKADLLGEEWLGRKIDADFVSDLGKLKNITPCGETGEYHTLVTDGPMFQKKMKVTVGEKILREGHWFLDIGKCELTAK